MADHDTHRSQSAVTSHKFGRTKVVDMPSGEPSVIADFLRFHVLVRVFDGDADQWLSELQSKPPTDDFSAEIRFVRWIRSRLRRDPSLMASIRRMVDTTGFWERSDA
jgi:hypothetical protein